MNVCHYLLENFADSLNYTIELPIEPFSGAFYPSCQSGMESQLTECLIQHNETESCSQPAGVQCIAEGENYHA